MKILKKPWFIPIVLTILILIIGNFYTKQLVSKAETLPEDEIRQQLEEMYEGEVERLSLKGSMYEVELSRSNAVYLAEVDAETGKVLSLFQTKEKTPLASAGEKEATSNEKVVEQPAKEKEPSVTPPKSEPDRSKVETPSSAAQEKKPTSPKKEAKTVLISKNQAIKIARAQLKGEVDDVEFVPENDGGYYLVEIEVEDDNDEGVDGAVYKIHAITGKIMNVTWED
ncbi:PepSY domain-containing protein [Sporosarcina sp. ACRSM]|uniref:PepSY domain-containing protein n=1 Tax=Sporosarcina sp. ACRSM TaxID=2918216 RepID=UPI001EF6437B|nr:PepSY domain-containing protein [Sporosarcina sp. ACRSM]MCG7334906.1 PepSY domain-containing protein [Sporosarcina sp. ACRSM]